MLHKNKKLRVCAKQIMVGRDQTQFSAVPASGKYRISWSEIQKQSFNILQKDGK